MRRTEIVHTRFQSLEIWKSALATEFRVAGAIHAAHHRKRFLTGLAWDLIAAAALLRPAGPPRSVLMLGLAGGTSFRILRHLLPDCRLTAVDIDGEIIHLARRHMDLDALEIDVLTCDAYRWLEENKRQFDVVIDDIYLAGQSDVFRPRELCSGSIAHLRRAVAPDGTLAVNLVTGPGHRGMQSRARRTLCGSFSQVRSLRTSESMNEVLVAGASVATRRQLDGYAEAFADWRDTMFWRRIELRKLQ